MGETRVKMKVFGGEGSRELEALVDTGATFSKIPLAVAEEVGLETKYETTVELSNGRLTPRRLGLAEVEIHGVRRPTLVAVSSDEEKPLIGYTTLEALEFKVNPPTGKLEKTRPIEY